jgi:NifU-like protein involved in Fe-S cluster formation
MYLILSDTTEDEKMDSTRRQLLSAMGFSDKAITILDQKINMRTMENPTVKEQHQGSCGDILMLSLKLNRDIIEDALYEYIGCAGLQACASAMTEMIKGMPVHEAQQLDVDDIIGYLQGIPKQKYECAEISRDTLRQALTKLPE